MIFGSAVSGKRGDWMRRQVHFFGWFTRGDGRPALEKQAGPRSMWELARREHESMNSRVRGVCLTFCFEEGEGAFCRCSVVERGRAWKLRETRVL